MQQNDVNSEDRIREVMQECIDIALRNGTPFVAAILSKEGKLWGIAANQAKTEGPLSHAEMNVLSKVGKEKCNGAILISTCEPCPMCTGAALWSRISSIYFGASIEDAALYMNQVILPCDQIAQKSWDPPEVVGGILREKCIALFSKVQN